MRTIAVPAVLMIGFFTVASAHSQTPDARDPKAQQKATAKGVDEKYELTRKGSSWAVTPKPMSDPWQTVKSPPLPDEKK